MSRERRSVVIYRRGPRWDATKPLGGQKGVHDHIAFLTRLHGEGLLERGGPFHRLEDELDDDLVGLVVHRGTVEQARGRALRDPAVRSGLLEFDARDWHA